jgi:hypothetical protein
MKSPGEVLFEDIDGYIYEKVRSLREDGVNPHDSASLRTEIFELIQVTFGVVMDHEAARIKFMGDEAELSYDQARELSEKIRLQICLKEMQAADRDDVAKWAIENFEDPDPDGPDDPIRVKRVLLPKQKLDELCQRIEDEYLKLSKKGLTQEEIYRELSKRSAELFGDSYSAKTLEGKHNRWLKRREIMK